MQANGTGKKAGTAPTQKQDKEEQPLQKLLSDKISQLEVVEKEKSDQEKKIGIVEGLFAN